MKMKIDFNSFISAEYNNDYRTPIKKLFEDEDNSKYSFDFVGFPEECIKYVQQHPNYHEKLHHLLDAYERFFVNNGLKDRYRRVYCQIYYCFYCLWKIESWRKKFDPKDRTWIQDKWLSICIDSASDSNIGYFFQDSRIDPTKPIDAEIEIQNVLFDEGKLKEEFKGPEREPDLESTEEFKRPELEPDLESILDWFLRRYNLALATKLAWILCKKSPHKSLREREISKKVFSTQQVGNWLVFVITLMLLGKLGYNYWRPVANAIVETCSLLYLCIPTDSSAFFTTMLVILYPGMLLSFLGSFYRRTFLLFKLLLPRLIGGIIVGYLPLILAKDAWNMAKEMNVLEGFCIVTVALGFSFYYIFIEIHNTLKDKWVSFGRALRVFSMGLLESFVIGIIVSDLFARPFYPSLDGCTVPGLVGYIYPKLLYLYFPLALLIGIFVQIIWEEKPITQPL